MKEGKVAVTASRNVGFTHEMNAKMKVYVTVVGFSCWMVDFVGKAYATWGYPKSALIE